jgi:hypothetical protein
MPQIYTLQDILNDIGISQLTNTPDNTFWYSDENLTKRFGHENAKVGQVFWDGNNGDKHEVLAVNLKDNRLAFRNLDQNEDWVRIAYWGAL